MTVRSWAWDRLDSDRHGQLLAGRWARCITEIAVSAVIVGIQIFCHTIHDRLEARRAR